MGHPLPEAAPAEEVGISKFGPHSHKRPFLVGEQRIALVYSSVIPFTRAIYLAKRAPTLIQCQDLILLYTGTWVGVC